MDGQYSELPGQHGLYYQVKKQQEELNRALEKQRIDKINSYKNALAEARKNVLAVKRAQEELNRALERQRELKREHLGEAKSQLVRSGLQMQTGW